MDKVEELNQISKSLIQFLIKENMNIKNMSVFQIFNIWSKKEKVKITHKENTLWAMECIKSKDDLNCKINYDMLSCLSFENE